MQVPSDIALRYLTIATTQLNLEMESFDELPNYELGDAKLYIKGNVIGVDTILCEPTRCEVAPCFHVDSWALVGNVANLWMFPN